jgi:hypothetical protein
MVKIENDSLVKRRDTNKKWQKPHQDKHEKNQSSPQESVSRCNEIIHTLKAKAFTGPPKK